ncbi:myoglobin-like isoform X2 [Mya arenaria]|uniref:myoglobin-like isoform X2 n=1 Tax=Mya arenaria TaxID=6604 RepID=UPI0022E49207|nr:myoglobin-like isoform X2 [Mya arenaria]
MQSKYQVTVASMAPLTQHWSTYLKMRTTWNVLAKQMPELVGKKELRAAVNKMPLLDVDRLCGYREHRLAHVQLSLIGAAYIWQEGDIGVAKELPKCLSVPWVAVSRWLGIQPILSHSSLVLANCRYDTQSGLIESLYNLPGGSEAAWFVTVTAQVELAFATGIKDLLLALYHAQCGDLEALTSDLLSLPDMLYRMQTAVAKMHEKLSAETFYDIMRPFLNGWGGASSPLPDGVIYRGISDQPVKMTGGSAAQSSTLQCIDAVLGVQHEPEIGEFLQNMRRYMPTLHRQFIETIEEHSKVKSLVESSENEALTSAYNQALQAVIDFRSYHVQIVTKYIVVMANRKSRNKEYEALATRGTGGSSILPFLKSLRTTTSNTKIPEAQTE